MAERRVLITGGTGYFGARLAEALAVDARPVVTQRSVTANRNAWLAARAIEAVAFDSASQTALPVEGYFDAIVNLAMPGAAEAARDFDGGLAKALATARACLRLLEEGRTERLIHFSTFHVYGGAVRARYVETDEPAPGHPYGRIHLGVERLLLDHARRDQIVVLRVTNLAGAPAHADLGEQAKLLFVDLCRQAAAGAMTLHNDGLSYRDFLPFEDAIAAIRHLLALPLPGPGPYNLGCGTAMRLDYMANTIKAACGRPVSVTFGTGTDAFREPFTVDVGRLAALGWRPQAGLAGEAARCVGFFS